MPGLPGEAELTSHLFIIRVALTLRWLVLYVALVEPLVGGFVPEFIQEDPMCRGLPKARHSKTTTCCNMTRSLVIGKTMLKIIINH